MASATDTQTGSNEAPVAVATTLNPDVKIAAAQTILSEGNVEVSEILRARKEETLVLVQRLLASAGIQVTLSSTQADEPNTMNVGLSVVGKDKHLSPEQTLEEWLGGLEARFEKLDQLHGSVVWPDVLASLEADPASMAKLRALDARGHDMNVFRFDKEKGEYIFVSGWTYYKQVSPEHRNITYDLESQKSNAKGDYIPKPRGNAIDIATAMGVDVADPSFHEKLMNTTKIIEGEAWLKTDPATRKTGRALYGGELGIFKKDARFHSCGYATSFRAELRVKKAPRKYFL